MKPLAIAHLVVGVALIPGGGPWAVLRALRVLRIFGARYCLDSACDPLGRGLDHGLLVGFGSLIGGCRIQDVLQALLEVGVRVAFIESGRESKRAGLQVILSQELDRLALYVHARSARGKAQSSMVFRHDTTLLDADGVRVSESNGPLITSHWSSSFRADRVNERLDAARGSAGCRYRVQLRRQ